MASGSVPSEIATGAPMAPVPPSLANSKTSVASPKVSAMDGSLELHNMESVEDKLPLHEDIMQLARLGEIEPIKRLLEDGKFDAQYQDEEGITPLHVCNKVPTPVLKPVTDAIGN